MDMETTAHAAADQTAKPALALKCCPFCGGGAEMTTALFDEPRHGVHCPPCRVGLFPVYETQAAAVALWNWRNGTASASGGRATRGLRSRRKLAAAKRNLKLARKAKQIKRVRAKTDEAVARLRPYREAERLRLEALAARSRSRLDADPALSRLLNLVRPGQGYEEPGHAVNGG
jgi:hypothetical protein